MLRSTLARRALAGAQLLSKTCSARLVTEARQCNISIAHGHRTLHLTACRAKIAAAVHVRTELAKFKQRAPNIPSASIMVPSTTTVDISAPMILRRGHVVLQSEPG